MAVINAETVARNHADNFGYEPIGGVFAPGRVNLIGDHTDYNDGYVFPVALEIGTYIAYSRNTSGRVRARSMNMEAQLERDVMSPVFGDWLDYVIGALQAMVGYTGNALPSGLDLTIGSTVPTGASVSSSAALQVATLRAAVEAFGIEITPEKLAELAQSAENNYVGVNCGLMDQMASSTGQPGSALFFDTMTLETTLEPLPTSHSFVTLHSGLTRQLTSGAYNERRSQCEAAAEQLSLPSLRTATLQQVETLSGKTQARARHVVTENARVLEAREALGARDMQRFGQLMTESHWSLSRDFETSTREVDALIESCLSRDALGARITGAGFGGCVVALIPAGEEAAFARSLKLAHPTSWHVATSTGLSG